MQYDLVTHKLLMRFTQITLWIHRLLQFMSFGCKLNFPNVFADWQTCGEIGGAEIARPDIARPDNAAPD